MSGMGRLSSRDPLIRRALLFSLAIHLATLAWVQTPVWEATPPPLVITAHMEPLAEPSPEPTVPRPTPAPVQMPSPAPAPASASAPPAVVTPASAPSPLPPSAEAVPVASAPPAAPSLQPLASTVAAMVRLTSLVPDSEWYPARKLDAIPRRLGTAQPKYPEAARRQGVTGSLKVRLRVNALGEVETVEIVSAQPEGVFDASAQAFFKAARYQPPQREGHPVRAVIEERISFVLNDDF